MVEVDVLPSSADASVEAGVRVLIGTMVPVNPASASGSRVKNNTIQHSVSTSTQAEVFLDS